MHGIEREIGHLGQQASRTRPGKVLKTVSNRHSTKGRQLYRCAGSTVIPVVDAGPLRQRFREVWGSRDRHGGSLTAPPPSHMSV